VQARDARGTLGPVVSDGIVLDATAPVASAPRITLRAGILGPGARSIPVRVAWSVADHVSGVVSAQVHADCDGTSLTTGDLGAGRSAPRLSITGFVDDVLAPGARCVSSASAEDAAGNRADSGDKSVTVRLVQEAPSGAVVYSPGWRPVVSATASGGALRTAMALDRWVHFRFDGTQIALVTARGPGRGRVAITIDGVPTATVDLGSTTRASRLVVFRKQLPAGRHTIEVRTMGTVHTPRTGARVDIDGFLVIGP
ncbi:MAG: hypothetical protein LH650_03720, partial [Chloroflexi bacterium]|nr:hypothetical protein [Chloroflexota bacterium]